MVLSIACFVASAKASEGRLVVLLVSGLALVCLPLIPVTIRNFEQTYLNNDTPPFLSFVHLGASFLSIVFLTPGLVIFMIPSFVEERAL